VRFEVERPGPCGPLPDEAGQHLEQILREALSNTARHAGACRVRVALVLAPDEVDLVVADDGCGPGLGVADGDGCGQGLRNMRERARRLGGRLVVEPAAGGGTRVTLAVPLDSEEPEDDVTPSPEAFREVSAP
jgi:signal transduction histidine kinase